MHGGSAKSGLDNSFVRLDLSTLESSAKWEFINYKTSNPSPRSNFSLELITTKAYLFGGLYKNEYLNDLWEFDVEK